MSSSSSSSSSQGPKRPHQETKEQEAKAKTPPKKTKHPRLECGHRAPYRLPNGDISKCLCIPDTDEEDEELYFTDSESEVEEKEEKKAPPAPALPLLRTRRAAAIATERALSKDEFELRRCQRMHLNACFHADKVRRIRDEVVLRLHQLQAMPVVLNDIIMEYTGLNGELANLNGQVDRAAYELSMELQFQETAREHAEKVEENDSDYA